MLALWIVLPARTLYSWETGAIASKAECAAWFAARHPGLSAVLMREAIAWREAGFPDSDRVVRNWGPHVPALTNRLAAFLLEKASGREPAFDSAFLERPLRDLMSDLYRAAHERLATMPAPRERYQPLGL